MFRKQLLVLLLALPFTFCVQAQEIDILILNCDFDKALEKINHEINQNPSAKLYFKRSMVHQQLMDYQSALKDLNQAVSLNPEHVEYLKARASISQSMGKNLSAARGFQKALKIRPNDLVLKYELGKTYLRLSDFKTAHETFEEIQAVDSTNLMFNKYSALTAYKANNHKRSVHLYKKYLLQNSNDLNAYINLSSSLFKLKKERENLNTLTTAHRKFPNNRMVHLRLANALFASKNCVLLVDIVENRLNIK